MVEDSYRDVSISVLRIPQRAKDALLRAHVTTLGAIQDLIRRGSLNSEDGGVPGIGDAFELEIEREMERLMRDTRSPWPFLDRHFLSLFATITATAIALWRSGSDLTNADEVQILVWIAFGLIAFELGRWLGKSSTRTRETGVFFLVCAIVAWIVLSKPDESSRTPELRSLWGTPLWVFFDYVCLVWGMRVKVAEANPLRHAPRAFELTDGAQARSFIALAGGALALFVICDEFGPGEIYRLVFLGGLLGLWEAIRRWGSREKVESLPKEALAVPPESRRCWPIFREWLLGEIKIIWPVIRNALVGLLVALLGYLAAKLRGEI